MDLGLALVVSAWLHLAGFAFLRYVAPFHWPQDAVQPALEIALAVPVTLDADEPTEASAAKENEAAASEEAQDTASEALEDTISLESKAPKYLSYLQQVKNRIAGQWDLPADPVVLGQGGKVTVLFTLKKGGDLARVHLVASSGRPELDQAALAAIRRAGPFPAFPEHIRLERLSIRAFFDYRVQRIGLE